MGKFSTILLLDFVLIIGVLLFTACASQPPQYISTCPSMPTYSAVFQHQAAAQLGTLSPDSPLAKMIRDYIAVRQEIRVCQP